MEDTNLNFSQRLGLEPFEIPLLVNEISIDLRTELWNAFHIHIYDGIESDNYSTRRSCREFHLTIWMFFFKKTVDDFPNHNSQFRSFIKSHIQTAPWNKVYEFLEFLFQNSDSNYYDWESFLNHISFKMEQYNAGFTMVNFLFVPITNKEEINEIKKVQDSASVHQLNGIQEHLNASLQLISKKPEPDLRNSIKESISMVEVIARIIEPSENTLGKALNKLDRTNKINSTFKAGFEKFYAYTNDKNGIRHSLMDDSSLAIEDARFFLISCSAFTNYLIEKANKGGLLQHKYSL